MTSDMRELQFLNTIRSFTEVEGTGDDCSIERISESEYQLVSTDMLVEGNHFPVGEQRFALIGEKAVTVCVSDVYAMGGTPISLYLSLAVPKTFRDADIRDLYQGITEAARFFRVKIRGGDITSTTGPLVIDVVVIGRVAAGLLLTRSGTKPGDTVFVSGPLGGARAQGYELWHPYYQILPVDKIRSITATGKASAMTDISDGLGRSLFDIASSSGVGFEINEERIRLAAGATIEDALQGGEDYQVLFTVPGKDAYRFTGEYIEIGEAVSASQGILVYDKSRNVRCLKEYGYDHFR